MRTIVKNPVIEFDLYLKCCECGRFQRYIIGYNYKSLKEAKIHIPTHGWNGWYLANNIELCPICIPNGLVYTEIVKKIMNEGKKAFKKGKKIKDYVYTERILKSNWLTGFLVEKYKQKAPSKKKPRRNYEKS